MARPKKSESQQAATVKIENAFWALLEKESFSNITVRLLSQEAGINRNSFYYHYDDMNDLASKAFRNNANEEVSGLLISALLSSVDGPGHTEGPDGPERPAFDPALIARSRRIMLCAGSDSSYLRALVENMLKRIWLEAFSIREDLLSDSEKLQITFIFSGLTAVLGSEEVRKAPLKMLELARMQMGRASIEALKKISASQDKGGRTS